MNKSDLFKTKVFIFRAKWFRQIIYFELYPHHGGKKNIESDIYIWHLYLTITFDIYIWHLSLTFISDISIWHLYLTFTFDIYIWHLYLALNSNVYWFTQWIAKPFVLPLQIFGDTKMKSKKWPYTIKAEEKFPQLRETGGSRRRQ